jgi:hypothetical protein
MGRQIDFVYSMVCLGCAIASLFGHHFDSQTVATIAFSGCGMAFFVSSRTR